MVSNTYNLFKLITIRRQIHLTLGYLPLRLPIPFLYQIDTDTDTNFLIRIKQIPILIQMISIAIAYTNISNFRLNPINILSSL